MNVLKKFAVSLTALTTLATLGIGSFSVSANELTAKEKFIASFSTEAEMKAAKLFVENSTSLSEAESMMNVYLDGKSKIANSKKSRSTDNDGPFDTYTNFYSATNLSSRQHYGVVIANNGLATVSTRLQLNYNPSWIGFNSNLNTRTLNSGATFTVSPDDDADENYYSISGYLSATTSSAVPVAVLDMPFNVLMTDAGTNESFSEGTLRHKFAFSRQYCQVIGNTDTTFTYETYVAGDVNHDGIIDSVDSAYITDYYLGSITNLSFTYTDKNYNVAKIVNDLAIDADRDGTFGLADVIYINKFTG